MGVAHEYPNHPGFEPVLNAPGFLPAGKQHSGQHLTLLLTSSLDDHASVGRLCIPSLSDMSPTENKLGTGAYYILGNPYILLQCSNRTGEHCR